MPPTRRANVLLALAVGLGVVMFLGGIALFLGARSRSRPPFDPTAVAIVSDSGDAAARAEVVATMDIAEFQGIDQLGRTVDRSLFEEGYAVFCFGFTHCTLACPIMHGQIFRASEILADYPVRFVTVSVDPENDTPERLGAYTEQWGIDPDRWTFIRVERDELDRLLTGLHFTLLTDPTLQLALSTGGKMANIVHPTRFLLVGPGAEVIGMYRGMDESEVTDMCRDIARLLQDRS